MPSRLLLSSILLAVSVCWTHALGAAPAFDPVLIKGQPAHPTRILARRASGADAGAHATALAATGLTVVRTSALVPGLVVLDVEPTMTAARVGGTTVAAVAADDMLLARLEALRATGLYTYVEPDSMRFADAVPSDLSFSNGVLWGLRNTGQSGGVPGVDIGAEAAWDITTGSTGVIVAVIDSGIRTTHAELASQLWVNPREVFGNGLDDDNNGYIDDIHGMDSIRHHGDLSDDDGHGTHVAGVIGASANNGRPIVGVAWNIRIMACRFLDAENEGLTSDAIECLTYAVANGATIINCSWGSESYSQALFDALAAARNQGVLVVASAGNENSNTDQSLHYPSGYQLDNIVSVTAIDRTGSLASFANYGMSSVDIGAPGVDIYSTYHRSDADAELLSGTSMAAPFVTGVAALVRTQQPSISLADLRSRILQTAVETPQLAGRTVTGGRVNAARALTVTPDGDLELHVSPPSQTVIFPQQELVLRARVTDITGVTGATVTGAITGGGVVVFRDDGVAPDAQADDASYTGILVVPSVGQDLRVGVSATAPGKTSAHADVDYVIQPRPANDMFAARATISGLAAEVSAANRGATLESGEPRHANQEGGASLWWTWTAPANSIVVLSTRDNTVDTVLAVYTGATVDALTEVASNDDAGAFSTSSLVTFSAQEGRTYHFAVDGVGGATGRFVLDLATRARPANDDFARAIELVGAEITTSGTTFDSTLEPGEPPQGGGYAGIGTGSVWWKWTAPADGTAHVSAGAYELTEVFAGPGLESLVRAAGRRDNESGLFRGPKTFGALAGETYWIAVIRRENSPGGAVTLSLLLTPGPANDHFARASVLAGDAASGSGDTTGASREIGEPDLPGVPFGATLWWRWTPSSSGTARLLTTGSQALAAVAVFTGDSVSALSRRTETYEDPYMSDSAKAEWHVTAGTPYSIAVDSMHPMGPVQFAVSVVPTPANDDFADRLPLVGDTASAGGGNFGATREAGEPVHSGEPRGDSRRPTNATLWWSWTAPADGTAIVSGNHVVAVYTGTSLGLLARVEDADAVHGAAKRVIFRAQAGTPYQIARDSRSDEYDDLAFTVTLHDAPANDTFASRPVLTDSSVVLTGDTRHATREPGEARPYYNVPAHSGTLWWTWVAPFSGSVTLTGTSGRQLAAVLQGDPFGVHQVLVQAQDVSAGGIELRFNAVGGQAYHVAMMPGDDTGGPGSVALICEVPPVNDMFAERIPLVGSSATAVGSTVGATTELGEPSWSRGRTVWWTWTAPDDGIATISTAGSACDTHLMVWTGTVINQMVSVVGNGDVASEERSSLVRFQAARGTAYVIRVDVERGAAGSVALRVDLGGLPVNDQFAGRATLSGSSVQFTGSNLGATAEPGEPYATELPYGRPQASIWWSWTAPMTGTAVLRLGSQAHHAAFFVGTSFASMVRLPDVDSNEANVRVHVEAGQEYQIAIDSLSGIGSEYFFDLSLREAPANDMIANAAVLAGNSVTVTGTLADTTAEIGEQAKLIRPGPRGSLWWRWTAPRSGNAVLTASAPPGYASVQIYTGDRIDNLVLVSMGEPSYYASPAALVASAGTNYMIVVTAGSSETTNFTLRLEQPEPFSNDMFAARTELTGAVGRVIGNNLAATSEQYDRSGGWASLWWTWTAPASGTATFSLQSDPGVKRIGVFTGDTLNGLQEVANSFGRNAVNVRFHCTAGVTYQIALSEHNYTSVGGPFIMDYRVEPGPVNDMFADATELVGRSARVVGTTELGTPGSYDYYNYYNNDENSSLWWKWTAPADGMLVLDLFTGGQEALLHVVTGGEGLNVEAIGWASGASTEMPLQVRFPVSQGVLYRIMLNGPRGPIRDFDLRLTLADTPANDSFAGRAVLAGADVSGVGDNRGAGSEAGEHNGVGESSVWWTWTAPSSGRAVVSTEGSSIHTWIGVHTGSSLASLVPVAQGGSNPRHAPTNQVAFDVVAGADYQIAVDSEFGPRGDIKVRVYMVEPPSNDDFQARLALSGETVTVHGHNLGATSEASESGGAFASERSTVWWSWTAPRSGRARFSTVGSTFDTIVRVYRGATRPTLAMLGDGDGGTAPWGERRGVCDIEVVAGETYPVVVAGGNSAMGGITLSVEMYDQRWVEIVADGGNYVAGGRRELVARAVGLGPHTYQWFRDGVAIEGATGSTLVIESLQAYHAGNYRVEVRSPGYWMTSPGTLVWVQTPASSDSRLLNLSTRALDLTGDNQLIPGFVITGAGTKRMLIRAVGPGLNDTFGMQGFLQDPQMGLKRAGVDVAANDDWGASANKAAIIATSASVGAFPLLEGSRDAVILVDLPAGAYTAPTVGAAGGTGVAMVELYDADDSAGSAQPPTAQLVNISNRGFVDVGDKIMIPGFVVSAEGPRTFLIRGVGPGLATTFGLPGVLDDPVLTVFRGPDAILSNDNWSASSGAATTVSTAAAVGAFPLLSGSKDAAFVVTLPPGAYTVQATGKGATTGVALVEVYLVP